MDNRREKRDSRRASPDEAPSTGQLSAAGGWNPYTGQRIFRSARAAWLIYGQHRFSVSERTFYTHVGKGKGCPPREDGQLYVEDIEFIAQSQAWPVASLFVRPSLTGGEGESGEDFEVGAEYQKHRARKMKAEADMTEAERDRKLRELMPRSDYEKRLAAAAAVVSNGLETLVYDNVREIIHLCGGNPEKEDSLREYLLEKIRRTLHAFSYQSLYAVHLVDDNPAGTDWEEEANAYELIERAVTSATAGPEEGSDNGTGNVD